MKKTTLLSGLLNFALFLSFIPSLSAQIRLTEVAPTNTGQIVDEDNDHPDWIEIRNGGTQVANLYGWGLSDGGKPWLFPETNLAPGERLLVFASGKNRGGVNQPAGIDHWETALYESDEWRYFLGTTQPPANWNTSGFNSGAWSSGSGGFGYGDNDDVTIVPNGTISVYYRRVFTVADPDQLLEAVLSMDYDDGFVAYLNGQEIARSNNLSGPVDHTTLAVPDREASGLPPEAFPINALTLANLLVAGDNVLAVEVHNTAANSSDLTGRTWLHFGVASASQFFGPLPAWFVPGGSTPSNVLHTDFKLNFSNRLSLYDPTGVVVDSLVVGPLQPGHARMRLNDDGNWCITATPTPGNTNGWDCLDGYAAAPGFALPAGFYQGDQLVALTGGGEIRYTTDGGIPTEASPLYSTPIAVTATTVIRARRFDAARLPSAVSTATYFINDPTTLTAVSISLPPDDFSEVYDQYSRKGAVAVEYFDQNKQRQFVGDFAGYVVGNWSVAFDQKSLQFDADEEYGSQGEIQYPIFAPDKPIPSLRSFRIRNEDDDWVKARMRDRIVNELAAETHSGRAAYRNVAAFINGIYWGHYVARERLDNYFVRDNYGANPDSVNMVKTHYGLGDYLAEYGTIDDFYAMSGFIANNDMAVPANFQKAGKLLDLDNFTDYLATEIFVASTDWLQDYFNNIRLFKTEKNAPWKFLLWDVSYSSGNASGCSSCDVLGTTLGDNSRYARMLNSLLDNAGYRRYFINRFADLMNTAFLPTRAHALINTNAAEMGPEIDRHNQRWGTGDFLSWSASVDELRNFYSDRPFNQRQHIIDNFQLDQEVTITLNVAPAGAGTVKISTVVPKTLPWTGVYFHGNPVTVTAIPNPGYTFSNWSANPNIGNPNSRSFTADVAGNTTFTANFTGAPQALALSVSEINYHSDPTRDGGDWFEIRNKSNAPVDISDFSIADQDWFHRYAVPTGTVIPAGGHLVFANNPLKFNTVYPTVANVATTPLGFEFSDKSDEIRLWDRASGLAANAAYSDAAPWQDLADGFGLTLERRDNSTLPDQPESWFAGCVGGSPGTFFSDCVESALLTEINYNSSATNDAGDWIELHNQGTSPLDLSGWQLRDESNDHTFTIPAGTVIAPSEPYHVLYQDGDKFQAQFPGVVHKTGPIGFGFSGSTDMIRLYDPSGRLYLCMRYRDTAPWPVEADGGGFTLEKPELNRLLNDPAAWTKGCPGGSPGAAFDPDCLSVETEEGLSDNLQLQVWPNPATGVVNLNTEPGARVQVMDVLGRPVAQFDLQTQQASISTTALPRGLYFLSATMGGKQTVVKLLLE